MGNPTSDNNKHNNTTSILTKDPKVDFIKD